MDFGFTPEQGQLKQQVRKFLDAECPMDRVRTIMAGEAPVDRELWTKLAELGWLSLSVPEDHGGLGLAWEDMVVVAEEMGRSLFPSPFLAHSAALRAVTRMGSAAQRSRWLPALTSGESIATIAVLESDDDPTEKGVGLVAEEVGETIALSGEKCFVAYGQAADLILVAARESGGVSLFVVPADAPGVTITPLDLIDSTCRAANVVLESVIVDAADRLGEPGAAWGDLAGTLDAWTVGLCAEMVGAADASVTLAAEYAKVRKQFGSPIGRFQGVKHRLAELYVGMESARSLTYFASWAVDHLEHASAHVSMAKAYASRALDEAGEDCIQIHGAIGFTWECDAHLYYKRGRYCRNLAGSPEYHYERLLAGQGL